MRIVIVIALILGPLLSFGQFKSKKKPVSFQKHYNEILPYAPQYKLSGWIFAPGATYMLTPFIAQNKTFNETATQEYQASIRGLGKPGIYAEVGRYRMLPYWKFFKYMDYGISYKSLRGSERGDGQLVSLPGEEPIGLLEQSRGDFGWHYGEAFVNFNHIWRISKYNFIQHSFGANAGYAFITNLSGAALSAATNANPGQFSGQLHYKLGFGIKMRGNWLLIPSLETPILNVYPWENGRSSYGFFASRYRPIIFSLRFLLMRPSNTMDCTPVRTPEGLIMPTDMNKQQQLDQTK